MRARNLCIAVFLFLFTARLCPAQEVTVAAASDLQFAFQDVAARFEKDTGKHVKLIFGSSGNFFAQIQNGAPFDVYFSADIDYPKRLEAAGLTEPGTFYFYATGKIVLWVTSESKLDLSRGLQVLLDPAIRKIAIANPEHAPYGRAAVAALRHENIYDKVSSKFVLGENISQTASFVVSGNADIGIVALSLASAPTMKDKGKYAAIPTEGYPPIEQAGIREDSRDPGAVTKLRLHRSRPCARGKLTGGGANAFAGLIAVLFVSGASRRSRTCLTARKTQNERERQ